MVLKFLFLFLTIAPLSSWGFSTNRTQKYLQSARDQQLWSQPQWLKLGHYRQKWGKLQSPVRGTFFLAPQGATNPQAELEKTIEILFAQSSSPLHPQCKYLARTRWLLSKLEISSEDILSCPEQTHWKEQLGAKELFLVFASSDLNSAGSSFGHTFLRAHNPLNTQKKELLDYGINYAAMTGTESGALYALKGLFGSYPGTYSMEPYHQKLREYTNLEGRNIWEYKLNLTPEEVDRIIDHLLELEGSYAPYYFLSDNCSQQILELIEVGRPDLNISAKFVDVTIPLDTVKVLSEQNLLSQERSRTSLYSQWQSYYKKLDHEQIDFVREIVQNNRPPSMVLDSKRKQAEALEATLSYLAIQQYKPSRKTEQDDLLRHNLSLTRASLGDVTTPVNIERPSSPLKSQSSLAFYLGAGVEDEQQYVRLKFRRAFHDLLSEDSGLSPFSHLEVLGIEFRYYLEDQRTDLKQLTLLKLFNSSPITAFEYPSTWKVDLGADSDFTPYVHWGYGLSADLPTFSPQRASLLFVNENTKLGSASKTSIGLETLLMSKWHPLWRTVFSAKSLFDIQKRLQTTTYAAGFSWGQLGQYRIEMQTGDIPFLQVSMLF